MPRFVSWCVCFRYCHTTMALSRQICCLTQVFDRDSYSSNPFDVTGMTTRTKGEGGGGGGEGSLVCRIREGGEASHRT